MKGRILDDDALIMTADDIVATAIDDLKVGHELNLGNRALILSESVAFGHKFALVDIKEDEEIVKYGEVIGRASKPITAGDWVHVHNCESTRGRGDLEATEEGEAT